MLKTGKLEIKPPTPESVEGGATIYLDQTFGHQTGIMTVHEQLKQVVFDMYIKIYEKTTADYTEQAEQLLQIVQNMFVKHTDELPCIANGSCDHVTE